MRPEATYTRPSLCGCSRRNASFLSPKRLVAQTSVHPGNTARKNAELIGVFARVGSALRRALSTVARNGHLISDWMTLCRYLGLDQFDVESIAYRYSGVRDRCYQSLIRWTDIADATGRRLDVSVLLQVLRRSNSHKLAGNYSPVFNHLNHPSLSCIYSRWFLAVQPPSGVTMGWLLRLVTGTHW